VKITLPEIHFVLALLFNIVLHRSANAQVIKANDQIMAYRASASRINDLIYTKLDVHFNYRKYLMYGKEWVPLKPHFYPTDTLKLDARGNGSQIGCPDKKWQDRSAQIFLRQHRYSPE
jgi:hypothetical protein